MEELLWSAGNVELVPTLLSTPLKPEAHRLQAGLPAGFQNEESFVISQKKQ